MSDDMLTKKKELLQHLKHYGIDTLLRLSWTSDKFRSDKEIVLAFLEIDGFQLESASDKLRDDKEVVLTAINQDGASLKYASERFRNDKEIVLIAIANKRYRNISILESISEDLRNDEEIILADMLNPFQAKYEYCLGSKVDKESGNEVQGALE